MTATAAPVPPNGFARHSTPDGGLSERLGPLYSKRFEGRLRFAFHCEEGHTNAMGGVHGGLLMTLADQVLGLTVQDVLGHNRVATVSLNCDFVRGLRPGCWVEGEARVTRVTRDLVFVEGTIDHGGATVLTASGLWYRRSDAGARKHAEDRP